MIDQSTFNWSTTMFVKKVALGSHETRFVPSHRQFTDVFTKSLSETAFLDWDNKLGFCPEARACSQWSDR